MSRFVRIRYSNTSFIWCLDVYTALGNKSETEVYKQEGGCLKHFYGMPVVISIYVRPNRIMLHQNCLDAF
jgi:hypothetical protein